MGILGLNENEDLSALYVFLEERRKTQGASKKVGEAIHVQYWFG